jgi:hypothetical protein
MPREDRTGPQGQGPRTGKGQGRCNPKGRTSVLPEQGGMGSGQGQGAGQGQGRGRGTGRGSGRNSGQGRGNR